MTTSCKNTNSKENIEQGTSSISAPLKTIEIQIQSTLKEINSTDDTTKKNEATSELKDLSNTLIDVNNKIISKRYIETKNLATMENEIKGKYKNLTHTSENSAEAQLIRSNAMEVKGKGKSKSKSVKPSTILHDEHTKNLIIPENQIIKMSEMKNEINLINEHVRLKRDLKDFGMYIQEGISGINLDTANKPGKNTLSDLHSSFESYLKDTFELQKAISKLTVGQSIDKSERNGIVEQINSLNEQYKILELQFNAINDKLTDTEKQDKDTKKMLGDVKYALKDCCGRVNGELVNIKSMMDKMEEFAKLSPTHPQQDKDTSAIWSPEKKRAEKIRIISTTQRSQTITSPNLSSSTNLPPLPTIPTTNTNSSNTQIFRELQQAPKKSANINLDIPAHTHNDNEYQNTGKTPDYRRLNLRNPQNKDLFSQLAKGFPEDKKESTPEKPQGKGPKIGG